MSDKWTKIRNTICATCLARERKLFPLRQLKQLPMFFKYLPLSKIDDNICWECKANVTKMIVFQEKALKAQALFTQVFNGKKNETTLQSLSNLTTTTKGTYDETVLDESLLKCMFSYTDVKVENETEDVMEPPTCETDSETESETEFKEYREKMEIKGEQVPVVENSVSQIPRAHNVNQLEAETDSDSDDGFNDRMKIKEKYKTIVSDEIFRVLEGDVTVDAYKTKPVTEQQMIALMNKKRSNYNFKLSRFKCTSCVQTFYTKKILDEHVNSKHIARKFKCKLCEQTFHMQKQLDDHAKKHLKSYVCCACGVEHFQAFAMWNHYESKHALVPKYCNLCNERLPTMKELRKHKREVHSPTVTCDICSMQFKGKPKLEAHMRRHMTNREKLECRICHQMYSGESGLRAHVKRQHKAYDDKEKEAAYCPECDVQFKDKALYKVHLANTLRHNPKQDFKYKCEQCGKGFMSKTILNYHTESVHSDVKKYGCQMCKQAFKTKRTLRQHVREKHEGREKPKNQICEICAKAFITKGQLSQHMNGHTGARPYACTTCGATFGHSGALYTHNRLKHGTKQSLAKKPQT